MFWQISIQYSLKFLVTYTCNWFVDVPVLVESQNVLSHVFLVRYNTDPVEQGLHTLNVIQKLMSGWNNGVNPEIVKPH